MKLTIAAIVSTIAAMVFCLGYAGTFGVIATRQFPNSFDRNHYGIEVDRGSIAFWSDVWHPYKRLPGTGWFMHCVAHPQPPDLKLSIWHCEAGSYRLSSTSHFGVAHIVSFSIWFTLLPCLIAPLLWLRRWRLRKQPSAFAVITNDTE